MMSISGLRAEEITQQTLSRYKAIKKDKSLQYNAFDKSLRSYGTNVHPLFKERLATLCDTSIDDISQITSTTSYQQQVTREGLTASQMTNYIMQPMFDQEEPQFGKIIPLKCSTRTRAWGEDQGVTNVNAVSARLRILGDEKTLASISEFCVQDLEQRTVNDLLQSDFRDSSFCSNVLTFLQQNDYSFPSNTPVHVVGRIDRDDLEMASKYYPTRNDERAFCKDRNLTRHITGCCLHRLFHPRDKRLLRGLSRNRNLPAMDKNTINICFPTLAGVSRKIIVADISNFTGSAGNAWIMLFCMAIQLSEGGTWDKMPNLFSVRGTLFSATWKEIIVLYLYTTVGVFCSVEGYDQKCFLPGGYLGVAANITVGLVMLSTILENFRRREGGALTQFFIQIGGDDMFYYMEGDDMEIERISVKLREELVLYVGHLKEFNEIWLDEVEDGLLEIEFCRKRLRMERHGNKVKVISEPVIPLPSCLLKCGYLKDSERQMQAWKSLYLSTSSTEKINPETAEAANVVREFFLMIYPNCRLAGVKSTVRGLRVTATIYEFGVYHVSERAFKRLCQVSPVRFNGLTYLDDISSVISHMLSAGKLTLVKATLPENEIIRVVCLKGDRIFEESNTVEVVGTSPNAEPVNTLLKLY